MLAIYEFSQNIIDFMEKEQGILVTFFLVLCLWLNGSKYILKILERYDIGKNTFKWIKSNFNDGKPIASIQKHGM